jgi:hypothetical protein
MEISVGVKNLSLLNRLVGFFGCGSIYINGDIAVLRIWSLNDIVNIIIPHFDAYPLCSQKQVDFAL